MEYKLLVHIDVSEPNRLRFALDNIRNFFKGLGDNKGDVVLVANGPAVLLFTKEECTDAVAINEFASKGVKFQICNNALTKFNVTREQLVDNLTVVPAGMVALVEWQQQGYAYVKP